MQTTADQDPVVDSTIPGPRNAPRSQTINRIAGSAHEAVDRIAQGADSALESLRHGSESWKTNGDQSLEHVQAYVREKPLMALCVAVAAGFLLSRFIR